MAATTALTLICSWHHPFGTQLPALGAFLSPFTGFWQNAEPIDALADLALSFPELEQPAQVVFDERAVPHIFAGSRTDAAFVQGYLTARDRLWQMDISVRATEGRLSEVLGEGTVARDRMQRRKGLRRAAENALKAWQHSPDEMAIINAYTAGANAWIGSLSPAEYPVEFKLLGYRPEAWTPLHTAIFFKSMAETLCFRHHDIPATNTRKLLGDALFDYFFPEYNPDQSPIIPESVDWPFEAAQGAAEVSEVQLSGLYEGELMPMPPPFIGSNNWAVSGDKTASGSPILCNDPHLSLTLPSIWYEIQISTPEYEAYGVSLPGVPGIIIGFNRDIAWGVTNAGHDVVDLYTIEWADEQKRSYILDGAAREAELVEERIVVAGQREPVLDTVRYTYWGPVAYESGGQDLAMHWLAVDELPEKPFYELGTFMKLMGGKGLDDYREALKGYSSPTQNFAFASREGDIAMTVNGRLPIKADQQGRFIQDGTQTANGWKGYIPEAHLPRVANPERGFISSANQHSTGPDYPYYYNGTFDDYRGRYINRRLDSLQGITVADMKALQLDNHSLKPEDALPVLLGLVAGRAEEDQWLKELKAWDYSFEPDARAPALFEQWFDRAYEMTFDDFKTLEEQAPVLYPEAWRFIELMEEVPEHIFFDRVETVQRERAADVVLAAWEEVVAGYEGQSWSDYKATGISHLGRIPAFSRTGLGVGGYYDAPNAIQKGFGPSWRMVVALGEAPEAYGVFPGGPSGNPGSPFYAPDVDKWAAGEYNTLHLMDGPGDKAVSPLYQMTFQPEKD